VVVNWVKALQPTNTHPRVIWLENVEEFKTWGPLLDDNMPDPARKGETFKEWVAELESFGYVVEHKELRACDYGAPTIRKRLFLIARRDGMPIVWPAPTHGAPDSLGVKAKKLKPWRTAADCIDWSIQAPSIFERKRALADATNRRIAKGIQRYVLEAAEPFIVSLTHQGGDRVEPIGEPFKTITGANRGEKALAVPTLIQTGYGERPGQAPRVPGLDKPLGTVVGGQKHALVSAFLAKHYTGVVGSDMADPVATVTSVDHNSLVTATMVTIDNQSSPSGQSSIESPLKTTVTENRHALVTANLIHMGHGEGADGTKRFSHGIRDVELPLNTITAQGAAAGMVTSHMLKLRGDNVGSATGEPVHTISAQGTHHAEVRAFLIKYYGTDQDPQLQEPLHTVTTKDRFGAVTVHAAPLNLTPQQLANAHQVALFMRANGYDYGDLVLVTIGGVEYVIVDIGLRMLAPRELYRAQGFPESYRIDFGADGRPLTKTAQVRMCGNSVCPPLARAIVAANYQEAGLQRRAA
jgi:DNA (cytosine-5)-methyltransferase 1